MYSCHPSHRLFPGRPRSHSFQPNHEQQDVCKHSAAREKMLMQLHEEQMEEAGVSQAARDGDEAGPRRPAGPGASMPAGRCLFPSEPEIHPTFTRRGLAASTSQARVRRCLLYLGHQQPWAPSGVLCDCSPCHMPQKWTVTVTSSSSPQWKKITKLASKAIGRQRNGPSGRERLF